MAIPVDPGALADRITDFIVEQLQAFLASCCPQGRLPRRFLGYPVDAGTLPDLIQVLSLLPELALYRLGGRDVEDRLIELLPLVEPQRTQGFGSYRLGESLARFGAWGDNNLLDECDQATRQRLLQALDSTHLLGDRELPLAAWPVNYWAVLARCEVAREALGVLDDRSVLDRCLEACNELLAESTQGFIDTAPDGCGRYDIYSADFLCTLVPVYDRLERPLVERALEAHRQLFELGLMPSGGGIVWGRSTGLLSIALCMEFAAALLAQDRCAQPEQMLAQIGEAFDRQRDWWQGGLVTAHRGRSPHAYQGPGRLLQISLDMLGRLAAVAVELRHIEAAGQIGSAALPAVADLDRFLPFDAEQAGVWLYRHGQLAFQLPVVGELHADYLPWPRAPGLFEVPTTPELIVGLPLVLIGDRWWTVAGMPSDRGKTPGLLSLRYEYLRPVDALGSGERLPAEIRIIYRANGSVLTVQHDWRASGLRAASIAVPESGCRLSVQIDGRPLACRSLQGLAAWRSHWSELGRLHEGELPLARAGHLQCSLGIRLLSAAAAASVDPATGRIAAA